MRDRVVIIRIHNSTPRDEDILEYETQGQRHDYNIQQLLEREHGLKGLQELFKYYLIFDLQLVISRLQ
jgi:hypothetical protein